jgi:hypothetical protein
MKKITITKNIVLFVISFDCFEQIFGICQLEPNLKNDIYVYKNLKNSTIELSVLVIWFKFVISARKKKKWLMYICIFTYKQSWNQHTMYATFPDRDYQMNAILQFKNTYIYCKMYAAINSHCGGFSKKTGKHGCGCVRWRKCSEIGHGTNKNHKHVAIMYYYT